MMDNDKKNEERGGSWVCYSFTNHKHALLDHILINVIHGILSSIRHLALLLRSCSQDIPKNIILLVYIYKYANRIPPNTAKSQSDLSLSISITILCTHLVAITALVINTFTTRFLLRGVAIILPKVIILVREFPSLNNFSDGLHLSSFPWSFHYFLVVIRIRRWIGAIVGSICVMIH